MILQTCVAAWCLRLLPGDCLELVLKHNPAIKPQPVLFLHLTFRVGQTNETYHVSSGALVDFVTIWRSQANRCLVPGISLLTALGGSGSS